MKKRVTISCFLLLSLFLCILGYLRFEPRIHSITTKVREGYSREKQRKAMHKQKVDIASLPVLEDEEGAWYTKYHVIAHAGGGIEGKTYTNSLEAWEYSYSRGTRVFDADCIFTTDGKLVLRHSWNDNLEQGNLPIYQSNLIISTNSHISYTSDLTDETDFETFMQRKIYHKYSPMSCEMMIKFMQEHEDLYVATDSKQKKVSDIYSYLVKTAKQMNAEEILNRIIVSIYDYKNYQEVLKIYPFQNCAIRQYSSLAHNYYELTRFCVENDIHVVNITRYFMEDEGIKLLTDKGIHLIVAVVDYVSDMQEYRKLGSSGCVSNFLYEDIYDYSRP